MVLSHSKHMEEKDENPKKSQHLHRKLIKKVEIE